MRRADRKLVKLSPVKNPFARRDSEPSTLQLIAASIKQYEASHEISGLHEGLHEDGRTEIGVSQC